MPLRWLRCYTMRGFERPPIGGSKPHPEALSRPVRLLPAAGESEGWRVVEGWSLRERSCTERG